MALEVARALASYGAGLLVPGRSGITAKPWPTPPLRPGGVAFFLTPPKAQAHAMERYCESLSLAGYSPASGHFVVYGWVKLSADNRKQALLDLDPVIEALKGLPKQMREFVVKPCPEEVIILAFHWLAERDGLEAAAAGLLQFDLYARPSEIFDLIWEDVIAPSPRA
ncbi:unnamed protein product [Prorocentrum cordatum]|uniref:RNA helicase n=1 Tax=Prorocentrum cordatum TaxID=2364126 RepID=A0ABN9UB97_9DINO|nr:unnamed protein product [Polarella glacialis]